MSLVWTKRVWASPEPTAASDRLLLLALADAAGDAGVCWPSLATLSRRCSVTRRAVIETLGRLERAGYVERVRTSGKHNRYRLLGAGGAVGFTGDVDDTGDVDRTGDADGTGAGHDTGTGAADRTGTGAADDTGGVPCAAPEPTRTVSRTVSRTMRGRGGAPTALGAFLPPGGDGAPGKAAVAGMKEMGDGPLRPPPPLRGTSPVPGEHGQAGGDGDVGDAAALLTARGVDGAPALRLVQAHGTARVQEVVRAFDAGRGKGPGWLVAALERGFEVGRRGASPAPLPAAGSLLTHAETMDVLRARGVVLDQLHPMTDYVDVVRTGDGVRFALKRDGIMPTQEGL